MAGPVKQAAGETQSLPALLLTHQPAWKGLVKLDFLSTASEVDVFLVDWLVGFGGSRGSWFLNMDNGFSTGNFSTSSTLPDTCSSVT